jgi:hypothetical protein
MKFLFATTCFALLFSSSFGQGCGCISKSKDKETGIVTKGGIVSSQNFYSLLINKKLNQKDSLNYRVHLFVSSKIKLSDSFINSKGIFQLFLKNGDTVVLENATCKNSPMGARNLVVFTVITTENSLLQLLDNPILKIRVFGILETEFNTKNQKKQQKIISCLKNEQ